MPTPVLLREGVTPQTGEVLTWDGEGWVASPPIRRNAIYYHTERVVKVVMGDQQSPDFVSGSAGWALKADGSIEGNNVVARGTIYASAGEVGGYTIGADNLYAGSGGNRVGLAPGTFPFYAGSETPSSAPFRVTPAGALTATGATITGTITATLGEVGGWTIAAGSLASGTDVVLDSANKAVSVGGSTWQAAGVQIQYNAGTPRLYAGNGAGNYLEWNGTILTVNGAVVSAIAAGSDLAIQGWQFTGVFSATDANTVAWTAGTLTFLSGASYNIDAGNTGNMAARSYIYFDLAVSQTVLQVTTTAASAVGANRVLIAVAEDQTTEATWQVFGGTGGLQITGPDIEAGSVTASQIAANTITASEIAANTITANEIAANTITAGEIAAGTITGTEIAANAIEASHINVSTLAAIQVNTGGLTMSGVLDIGASGGIYQGTGSFASPTTGLKVWSDSGVGRIAGYNGGTLQWYAGTDGKLYAGAGVLALDAGGIEITVTSSWDLSRSYQITDGANTIAMMGAWYNATSTTTRLYSYAIASKDTYLYLEADAPANETAVVYIMAQEGTVPGSGSVCGVTVSNVGGTGTIYLGAESYVYTQADMRVAGGLYVGGTSTDPATGNVVATADVLAGSGLGVGRTDITPADGTVQVWRSGADPSLYMAVTGSYAWSLGVDADDGYRFKFNPGATLADPSAFEVDGSGNVETAGDVRCLGGMTVGYAGDAATGRIYFTSTLHPVRSSIAYTSYTFVPLAAPATSTSWDGDAKTTANNGIIDLSAVFSLPAGIKAVLVDLAVKDATLDVCARVGPDSTNFNTVVSRVQTANQFDSNTAVVPCDSNGDVYFSVTGDIDIVWVKLWGYWL